jgi:hypothetical protein
MAATKLKPKPLTKKQQKQYARNAAKAKKAKAKADVLKKAEAAKVKARADARNERLTQEVLAAWHTPEGELITVEKAAEIIGDVKPRRVRQFVAEGRLPALRIKSTYLIKWSDLLNFKDVPRHSGRQTPYESFLHLAEEEKSFTPD